MIITQKPKYRLVPAYSNIIFTVQDLVLVTSKFNVKYIAEVFLGQQGSLSAGDKIATLKATPNSKGVGIFDLSTILQSYVESDNLGSFVGSANPTESSQFKSTAFSDTTPHSIHTIDKFCTNEKSVRIFKVIFKIQHSDTVTGEVSVNPTSLVSTDEFIIYNGTVQHEDIIALDASGNYGYNLDANNYIMNDTDAKFLTNCPTTIDIGSNDYHTLAFFSDYNLDFSIGGSGDSQIEDVVIKLFNDINGTGTQLATITIDNTPANGGKRSFVNEANNKLIFIGCGVANIKAHSSFNANTKSYTIKTRNSLSQTISQEYTFNIIDDDCKGFEKIRLTWLNRLGAWDYYSFTKRNVRTVETQRTSYKQISGLYNESVFMTHGYKGGQKTFNTNAKERLTLNTDFVTESTATWLEELFTSPEVYILNEFSTDGSEGYINKYVQPVTITSSTYTKQTRANDDLLQYTLEIERSKNRVIQNA
tara:strand:+ start:101 stop:1528 length:1428 start_codon:yes stop_codon:yes gene_type:complete